MIRDVVLHLNGELPMRADIESLPTAADAGLLCTNLRTLEGRQPVSVQSLDSVFLIPYSVIRFIEIPRAATHAAGLAADLPSPAVELPAEAAAASGSDRVLVTPAPVAGGSHLDGRPADDAVERLEPDAELLRRIREA